MSRMSSPVRDLIRSLGGDIEARPINIGRRASARRSRRRARRRGEGRTIKSRPIHVRDNEFNFGEIMNQLENDNKIFLGVSDFDDLITAKILQARVEAGQSTVHRETTVLCNRQSWATWLENSFNDMLIVEGSGSSGFAIDEEHNNYITYSVNSNSTSVRAHGDADFVESVIDQVETNFDIVTSYIEWVYGSDGHSVNVPLNRSRLPIKEMYPFLGEESLESFYDRYMESSANILLLIGPPGTGKTTFIRGLLSHREASAIVTYDANILEKDGFFARFIEDDTQVMVLEDSDAFLKSRSDGNTMMHRFLNVGDGLVTTKGKKMIFSTNLPSIRDIDSALIRPGRCFDIVTFDQLNYEQATALAKKLGVELPNANVDGKYSIAEVFNQQSELTKASTSNRKVGFI